jgi:hypothetical protein
MISNIDPAVRPLAKTSIVILSEAKNLHFKTFRFAQSDSKNAIMQEV